MGQKGAEIVGLDLRGLIEDLNRAYCDEWMKYYLYRFLAGFVSGPRYRETAEILSAISEDVRKHIDELAERVTELGGTVVARPSDLEARADFGYPRLPQQSDDLDGVILAVKEAERASIEAYNGLASRVFGKDHVTYPLVCRILADAVRHEELFESLRRQKV